MPKGVDVGGAWCWTSAHHEVPALARRFGVLPFPQHDEGLHVIDYGNDKPVTRHVKVALMKVYPRACFQCRVRESDAVRTNGATSFNVGGLAHSFFSVSNVLLAASHNLRRLQTILFVDSTSEKVAHFNVTLHDNRFCMLRHLQYSMNANDCCVHWSRRVFFLQQD